MPLECTEVVKGCNAIFRLTLVDENGDPVSLTGNRVRFALRRSMEECNPVSIAKDSDNGAGEVEILVAPNDNQALIKLVPSDTEDLEEGTYCYSIKVDFVSSGLCFVVLQGALDILSSAFDA